MTRALLTLSALVALAAPASADAKPAETAISPYPFATCLVSGEAFGREIKMCCKGCLKTFTKDPAKVEQIATLTPFSAWARP